MRFAATKILLTVLIVVSNVICFNPAAKIARNRLSRLSEAKSAETAEIGAMGSVTPIVPRTFLITLLSSRSSTVEKKLLLAKLQNLRMAGVKESSAAGSFNYAEFLDELLTLIDSVQGNIWARRRLPIPLPSLRLKMGSAKRLLNTLVETEEKPMEKTGDATLDSGKRRRALGILLNQLAMNDGGVRALELEALTRLTRTSMEEMLERTPKGLETPKYEVVYNKDTFQVRKYDAFAVCSMMLVNPQQQNGPVGFQTLAGYIFGKNVGSQAMAMTTPVISSGFISTGGSTSPNSATPKKMSFVMPSAFWAENGALNQAPKPLNGSGVELEEKGGGLIGNTDTVAVVWFGGYATKNEISARATELLKKIIEDGTWAVKEGEVPYLMQYNDPFVPPWARRNEVAIPVIRVNEIAKQ